MECARALRRAACAAALTAVVTMAAEAHAEWVVDEQGECVQRWTAASLGRGPAALLNAPLAPVRYAVGGVELSQEDRTPGWQQTVMLPPLLAVAGGATGLVASFVWMVGGLADTLTGGAFALAPDEATELSVRPIRPPLTSTPPASTPLDPCGRPTTRR